MQHSDANASRICGDPWCSATGSQSCGAVPVQQRIISCCAAPGTQDHFPAILPYVNRKSLAPGSGLWHSKQAVSFAFAFTALAGVKA